jgi:hypothetical protein
MKNKKQDKKKHGGKRSNAGRKPVADKKQRVDVFIETSRIEKRGGMDAMKKYLYDVA